MNVAQAQTLVKALQGAIDAANAAGVTEIDLSSQLDALDDKSRADLESEIKKHGG